MEKRIITKNDKLDIYINKCIEDACKAEKRENDVKFQYMIIGKELIFGIKSKYMRVRRRIEYRLLRNLKKNFGYTLNLVYPFSIQETGLLDSMFEIFETDYIPFSHAICKWTLFDKEYYVIYCLGNRPNDELGIQHIKKLEENGFNYPNGNWEEFSDAFFKAYNMTPFDSFIKVVYPEALRFERIKKQYEKDLLDHGCGYWSVCFEHGSSCPCSPTSKVMQGFDIKTWESLKNE